MCRKGHYHGGGTVIHASPLATSAWRENQSSKPAGRKRKKIFKPVTKGPKRRAEPLPPDPAEVAREEQARKLRQKRMKGWTPSFVVIRIRSRKD